MGQGLVLWRHVGADGEVEALLADLPAGVNALHVRDDDGHCAILISRHLNEPEKNAALAHELGHHASRGGCHHPGMPTLLRPLVARDEARVDRVAADSLLPLPRLAAWVDAEVAAHRPVGATEAVTEFQVARWVAKTQLARLSATRAA